MNKILDRISIDPNVCFGKPCIRGTRIWVSLILDYLASGMTVEEVIQEYPYLTHEDMLAANRGESGFINAVQRRIDGDCPQPPPLGRPRQSAGGVAATLAAGFSHSKRAQVNDPLTGHEGSARQSMARQPHVLALAQGRKDGGISTLAVLQQVRHSGRHHRRG